MPESKNTSIASKLKEIETLRYENPAASSLLAWNTFEQTRSLEDGLLVASSLASSMRAEGQSTDSIQLLKSLLRRAAPFRGIRGDIHRRLAIGYTEQSNYWEAERRLRHAFTDAFAVADLPLVAKCFYAAALKEHQQGNYQRSIDQFRSGLLYPSSDQTRGRAHLGIFFNYQRLERFSGEDLEKAIALNDCPSLRLTLDWLNHEANFLRGKAAPAASGFLDLRERYEEAGAMREAATAGCLAVLCYCRLGEAETARSVALSLANLVLNLGKDGDAIATLVSAALYESQRLEAAAADAETCLRAAIGQPRLHVSV